MHGVRASGVVSGGLDDDPQAATSNALITNFVIGDMTT